MRDLEVTDCSFVVGPDVATVGYRHFCRHQPISASDEGG